MFRITVLALFFLTLASCRATTYEPEGYYGGYSDTQLASNLFRVGFKGNSMVSYNTASDYLLLRNAEITLQNGYRYFVIIDKDGFVENDKIDLPSSSHTTISGTVSGDSFYGTANTTTIPGGSVPVSKPRVFNIIRLVPEKPESGNYFDAPQLKALLTKKYDL